MDEWKECELQNIAEVQTGPFGSQLKNEQYVTGGTPVVTVEHIDNFRIIDFDYPSVTDEDKNRLSKYLLEAGDIIFTRVGSVDLSAYVRPHQNGWMFSSRMLRVRVKKDVNSNFLAYFFRQKRFREYIINIAVGATMPSINTEILKGLPVAYPPLPEQKAIASVLSSLDDKIDLLHRQNKTLEAMAETLFRQWFVEEAQDDWEDGKLEDLFLLQRGFDLPRQKRTKGPYPIFAASGHSGGHEEFKVKGPGVTTGRSGLLGKVFFIMEDFWPLNTSLFIKEYKIATPLFSYFLLKGIDLEGFNAGSAVPTLNRNHVHELPISIPPKTLIREFENSALPSFNKIQSNQTQIRTLEKLRDTLLPKLMSGEVRVGYDH